MRTLFKWRILMRLARHLSPCLISRLQLLSLLSDMLPSWSTRPAPALTQAAGLQPHVGSPGEGAMASSPRSPVSLPQVAST